MTFTFKIRCIVNKKFPFGLLGFKLSHKIQEAETLVFQPSFMIVKALEKDILFFLNSCITVL